MTDSGTFGVNNYLDIKSKLTCYCFVANSRKSYKAMVERKVSVETQSIKDKVYDKSKIYRRF